MTERKTLISSSKINNNPLSITNSAEISNPCLNLSDQTTSSSYCNVIRAGSYNFIGFMTESSEIKTPSNSPFPMNLSFFEMNPGSPLKMSLDEVCDENKKTKITDYMNKFLTVLIDEVCVKDYKENTLKIQKVCDRRIVPQVMKSEDKNYELLDENYGILNEKNNINGKFGWFLKFFYEEDMIEL